MNHFKTGILSVCMVLITAAAHAQSWQIVGSEGFSASEADNECMAIDTNGTPYIVYTDAGNANKATVMKYNGTAWVTVGSAGFSEGIANFTSIAIDRSGTICSVCRCSPWRKCNGNEI